MIQCIHSVLSRLLSLLHPLSRQARECCQGCFTSRILSRITRRVWVGLQLSMDFLYCWFSRNLPAQKFWNKHDRLVLVALTTAVAVEVAKICCSLWYIHFLTFYTKSTYSTSCLIKCRRYFNIWIILGLWRITSVILCLNLHVFTAIIEQIQRSERSSYAPTPTILMTTENRLNRKRKTYRFTLHPKFKKAAQGNILWNNREISPLATDSANEATSMKRSSRPRTKLTCIDKFSYSFFLFIQAIVLGGHIHYFLQVLGVTKLITRHDVNKIYSTQSIT